MIWWYNPLAFHSHFIMHGPAMDIDWMRLRRHQTGGADLSGRVRQTSSHMESAGRSSSDRRSSGATFVMKSTVAEPQKSQPWRSELRDVKSSHPTILAMIGGNIPGYVDTLLPWSSGIYPILIRPQCSWFVLKSHKKFGDSCSEGQSTFRKRSVMARAMAVKGPCVRSNLPFACESSLCSWFMIKLYSLIALVC